MSQPLPLEIPYQILGIDGQMFRLTEMSARDSKSFAELQNALYKAIMELAPKAEEGAVASTEPVLPSEEAKDAVRTASLALYRLLLKSKSDGAPSEVSDDFLRDSVLAYPSRVDAVLKCQRDLNAGGADGLGNLLARL